VRVGAAVPFVAFPKLQGRRFAARWDVVEDPVSKISSFSAIHLAAFLGTWKIHPRDAFPLFFVGKRDATRALLVNVLSDIDGFSLDFEKFLAGRDTLRSDAIAVLLERDGAPAIFAFALRALSFSLSLSFSTPLLHHSTINHS